MRVADFFCGGGGFSEGFRQAGFEIVFAVDKWEPAVNTYKGNKPGVNVRLDDVIRISNLPENEFEALVPDSEVIIGSPPCQSFLHSNKSGNADKALGILLIEAYLRIVARKKFKENSILRYWVLENVPNVKNYIKDKYTAKDLGLEGDFVLETSGSATGVYNAKYYGAPTNRERFLCGEFPKPIMTKDDSNVITLDAVIKSLGMPCSKSKKHIWDVNYPDFSLPRKSVTDHHYVYELAPFEWETAKRLKQDKGYMGKMSFPEDTKKPARTVMATMSASSREAMILGFGEGQYRLPTVREAASMMSFPIDYWFFGESRGIKHTLVGNAVPPKMSFALALAMASEAGIEIPDHYIPIKHDPKIKFVDLNDTVYTINEEKPRRSVAKFKYHIPYLIYNAYRVELTNYHSDFDNAEFIWDAEIHYSQGKDKAKKFLIPVGKMALEDNQRKQAEEFIINWRENYRCNYNDFQKAYCMTEKQRQKEQLIGPYELLSMLRGFIDRTIPENERGRIVKIEDEPFEMPAATVLGDYILKSITDEMGGK